MNALKRDVLIVASSTEGYGWLFSRFGTLSYTTYSAPAAKLTKKYVQQFGLVVFTGGSDIDPSRYKEDPKEFTIFNKDRDEFEFKLAGLAESAGVPMVGICRGAQLGCVFNGGKLVQHMTGHTGNSASRHRAVVTAAGLEIKVSSDHHQSMVVGGTENRILMTAAPDLQIPELVWFPKTKFLAAQYHPEWMGIEDDAVLYFKACVEKLCFDGDQNAVVNAVAKIRNRKNTSNGGHNNLPTKSVTPPSPPSSPKEEATLVTSLF